MDYFFFCCFFHLQVWFQKKKKKKSIILMRCCSSPSKAQIRILGKHHSTCAPRCNLLSVEWLANEAFLLLVHWVLLQIQQLHWCPEAIWLTPKEETQQIINSTWSRRHSFTNSDTNKCSKKKKSMILNVTKRQNRNILELQNVAETLQPRFCWCVWAADGCLCWKHLSVFELG